MADNPTPQPEESAPTTPPPPTPGAGGAEPQAEALADGTVPAILTSGTTQLPVRHDKAALSSVYKRADITATLLAVVGVVVAFGLIIGGYLFLTQNKTKNAETQKNSTLDKAELEKLEKFFNGNTGGNESEVLTVNSSSLFKGRVAMASDVRVIGGVQVSGTTALGDLTVDKTSTLGVTNVRGSLTVAGPVNMQSPATLGGGATVNGNLSTTGNGSFGGSLSAGSINIRDLTVAGNLNLAGHLIVTGQTPTVSPASEAGAGSSANISGNDSAGTVTINTGAVTPTVVSTGGLLVTVRYRTPYGGVPRVLITPVGQNAGSLSYYVQKTADTFTIGVSANAKSNTTYAFDYWVVQ